MWAQPLVVSTVARVIGGPDDVKTGNPADSPEATAAYLEQLSWYDDELRRDPYVIGFAIFNAGSPGGNWASFDITDILPQLAGLVNSKD